MARAGSVPSPSRAAHSPPWSGQKEGALLFVQYQGKETAVTATYLGGTPCAGLVEVGMRSWC